MGTERSVRFLKERNYVGSGCPDFGVAQRAMEERGGRAFDIIALNCE